MGNSDNENEMYNLIRKIIEKSFTDEEAELYLHLSSQNINAEQAKEMVIAMRDKQSL